MSSDIQDPTLGQELQDDLQLRDAGRFSLESFILGNVQVGDLSAARRPPITRHVTSSGTLAAVVGQVFHMRLAVPAGVIASIRSLELSSSVATLVRVALHASAGGAPANPGVSIFGDGRLSATLPQSPACVNTFGARAAAIPLTHYRQLVAAGIWTSLIDFPAGEHRWVIGSRLQRASDVLELETSDANTNVSYSIMWQEWAWF
jgi:hypothetical protein